MKRQKTVDPQELIQDGTRMKYPSFVKEIAKIQGRKYTEVRKDPNTKALYDIYKVSGKIDKGRQSSSIQAQPIRNLNVARKFDTDKYVYIDGYVVKRDLSNLVTMDNRHSMELIM